jgi:flagellar biosynthesis protein FliR
MMDLVNLKLTEELCLFLYVLSRFAGTFLLSPLFTHFPVPMNFRVILTLLCALIVSAVIFPDYLGGKALYALPGFEGGSYSLFSIGTILLIELGVGYLIGFAFSLLFEAILLAGQLIDFSLGLSLSEIFDPTSSQSRGITGQMIAIFAVVLILLLDLHHLFFRVAAESFTELPIGQAHIPYGAVQSVTLGTARFFHHGVQFAAIPLAVLTLLSLGFGIMTRAMPQMHLFLIAFPLKLLIGFYCLILTIDVLPALIQSAFIEYQNLSGLILKQLST